jgi:hypothetical protein
LADRPGDAREAGPADVAVARDLAPPERSADLAAPVVVDARPPGDAAVDVRLALPDIAPDRPAPMPDAAVVVDAPVDAPAPPPDVFVPPDAAPDIAVPDVAVPDAPAPDLAPDVAPDLPAPDVAPDRAPDLAPDVTPDLAGPETPGAPLGAVCFDDGECGSGHCVYWKCCATACAGDCNFCMGSGNTCQKWTLAKSPDFASCVTRYACDERTVCKRLTGQPCTDFNDCLGEKCVGGVCTSGWRAWLTPELVDFGSVRVGDTVSVEYKVENKATSSAEDPFQIVLHQTDHTDFRVVQGTTPCGPTGLPAGGSCFFTVEFTPSSNSFRLATLELRGGASGITILTKASLAGQGMLAAFKFATISPTWHYFGETFTDGYLGPVTFAITNPAGSGAPVTSIRFEGRNGAEFKPFPAGASCTLPLAPGATCFLDVMLEHNSVPGPHVGRLVVTGPYGEVVAGMYGYKH